MREIITNTILNVLHDMALKYTVSAQLYVNHVSVHFFLLSNQETLFVYLSGNHSSD